MFREIVESRNLPGVDVSVLAKPLSPEEAIGSPGRRDFPIIIGKERLVEARVLGSKGHAFTDSPREFNGTLEEVLNLELDSSQNRAIYMATLNAALNHLNMAEATVHCRDDEPDECALTIADFIREEYGRVRVGLIGLNPAIAERLVDAFGTDNVRITDLSGDNIGKQKYGVEIGDGNECTEELIDSSDMVVITGTTLVNGTFDRIWIRVRERDKHCLVYGVTAAGVAELIGFDRICPCGRDG